VTQQDEEEALAHIIAIAAHLDQKEESTGDPYIFHVARVVALVSPRAKAAAWLHDVLEDSWFTPEDLRTRNISEVTIASVILLTHDKCDSYLDYIDKIARSKDPIAIEVKIADLKDHFRPNCPPRLIPKYRAAWAVLCPGIVLPGGEKFIV
jgi:(p)ppGpp synthase/HD superfamily hydrolase